MERHQFLQSTVLSAAATILGAPSNSHNSPFFSAGGHVRPPPPLRAPLTSENAALVLLDHQVGLMTGVRDYSTGELKHNVVALSKAAKALKLPIVLPPPRATRPCPCCGGRMMIIDTFGRGCQPKHRATPAVIRINTS
jgi:hypothetical protein